MRAAAVAAAALLLCGCSPGAPREAGPGDTVTLHWTAFVDSKVYDTTEDTKPVVFGLGQGALPPAVEAGVIGMRPGEEKTISVDGAYGGASEARPFPAEAFASLGPLKPGMKVLGMRDGKPTRGAVVKVAAGKVWLDFSHPLAGKTVGFRLRLVALKPR